MSSNKTLLIIYHSQGGTMECLAQHFCKGAAKERDINVVLKKAGEATLNDLLNCEGIAIASPEYFGTMAGMIKDFFDRTFQIAEEKTIGLPYMIIVCASNDGRGAVSQIERLAAGYKWKKIQKHIRIVGSPGRKDFAYLEEMGHTFSAGIDFGIF